MMRLYRTYFKMLQYWAASSTHASQTDGDFLVAVTFCKLQPLLEKALAQETNQRRHKMTRLKRPCTAQGLARAAEILAGQFTLIVTNVPYLGFGKQDQCLQEFGSKYHPDAKADLATCFLERCIGMLCSPDQE